MMSQDANAGLTADANGSSTSPGDRMATSSRRLLLEIGFTGLLVAGFAYGTLYFNQLFAYFTPATPGSTPATPGQPQPSVGLQVFEALLPTGVLVLLSLIERLTPPAGPRKSFRSWLLHLQINLFATFMFVPAGILTVIISSALSRHLGFRLGLFDLEFAHGTGLLVFFAAVWVSSISQDFFFYWFHRALHKSSFLWQHHKMHHMDPELEALSVSRQNWLEAFLQMVFISIPLAIFFRTDTLNALAVGLLGTTIGTFYVTILTLGHMNVRFQVGWASLFFCSPQIHRIHHSRLPQHRDRNFAFILPLWDVLFGTYYAPAHDEFPPTGVDGEKEIGSFWESQIYTQREWWKMFRACRRLRLDSAPI